jgi:hypothetical protein
MIGPVHNPHLDISLVPSLLDLLFPSDPCRQFGDEYFPLLKFGHQLPTPEAASLIQKYSNNIIEIGAGTGYWGYILNQMGIDITCFDICKCDIWHPVLEGGPEKVLKNPDKDLFLCWPPLTSNMAYESLKNLIDNNQKRKLIYIGEGYGGCTATNIFFELLSKKCRYLDGMSLTDYPRINLQVYQC